MAIANRAIPYGLRDIKVTPITAETPTYGTFVDLPIARTLSWTDTEDFEELRGDDKLQTEHGNGPIVEWELEGGGISLEALVVINGGAVTSTGTTPAVVKTYSKLGTDARPFFRIDGMAINDNGGDTKVVIYRCKANSDIEGSFEEGSFMMTNASGRGYPNIAEKLYDIVHSETSAAIVQPV